MKDLKPEDDVELIEMKVPIGTFLQFPSLNLESPDETASGTEEEAPPPAPFQFYDWDD